VAGFLVARALPGRLFSREIQGEQGVGGSLMVKGKDRSIEDEIELRKAQVIRGGGRQPFQVSSHFVTEVSDSTRPERRKVRPRFLSVGGEKASQDIKRIREQRPASPVREAVQMDPLAVSAHDQKGVQPYEGVATQGMISSARQERFVRFRIQTRKELTGGSTATVYLRDTRFRYRPGELQGE
jgi:hypothetical protein